MKVNYQYTGIKKDEVLSKAPEVQSLHHELENRTGKGNDFLGWLTYVEDLAEETVEEINAIAKEIQERAEALIVVGIGGSYLGSRAVIEALGHSFTKTLGQGVPVYFAGNSISGTYLQELTEVIKDKEIYVNVISKSGTTTEPAIAFRHLKQMVEDKYGKEEAARRIIATTDQERGALRSLTNQEGYRSFIIPDDVGGRFSVFTPVGLLPIAAAGIDIQDLLAGVKEGMKDYNQENLAENPAYQYAVLRNLLLEKDKSVEILVNYEPKMSFVAEWFKQLYGESEGKEGKGIYPSSALFSTDLHSLGQYIQDGQRFLFETILTFKDLPGDMVIDHDQQNLDGLNYIAGKTLNYVNEKAMEGTLLAHVSGGVPNIILEVPALTTFYLGKLLFFFMKACAMSGYLLGVNPFDQPGVESYKKNMFALLGKEGYEELREELLGEING